MGKQFLEVLAQHNPDGTTKPISIKWTDGRVYSIDRIMDVRQAAALKTGGCGMSYTCRIHRLLLSCENYRYVNCLISCSIVG